MLIICGTWSATKIPSDANVPNIEETRSISRFGLSIITVVFKENEDLYFARQLISEQLKQASEELPKGVETLEMAPVSTVLGEVYQYILHPKKGSEKNIAAKICEQCRTGLSEDSSTELPALQKSTVLVAR